MPTDKELKEMGTPQVFDNTMLSTWNKCPRAFYWFMRRLDPADTAAYFTYGRACGVILNTWHSTQGELPPDVRFRMALEEGEKEWLKDLPEEYGDNTWDGLQLLFQHYRLVYGDEELWTYPYKTGELGFTVPIPGTPYLYGGSIDAAIQWKNYGIFIREDKTTGGYITDSFLNQWDHASQVAGYIWAMEEVLGSPIQGVLMNVLSKKKRKAGDENLRFSRPMVTKSAFKREHFIQETVRLIQEIEREYNLWEWPKYGERDPINCAGGMGRSACPYRRLCLLDQDPWDFPENFDYGPGLHFREAWAPWDRAGENE
jgi:hypothetical protein